MDDTQLSHATVLSSEAVKTTSSVSVIEEIPESCECIEENTSMNSRVARLSICEDSNTSKELIANLLSKASSIPDIAIDIQDAPNKTQGRKIGNQKRRRSSAVSVPAASLLHNGGCEEPSINLTRRSSSGAPRKKKSIKGKIGIEITDKALEKGISVKDLSDLTLTPLKATSNPLKWARVDNVNAINKVVVLFVPGLEPQDFNIPGKTGFKDNAEALRKSLPKGLENCNIIDNYDCFPVQSPGSKTSIYSGYSAYVNLRLSKKGKKDLLEELGRKKITIKDLLMNLSELLEHDYSIHPNYPGLQPESVVELQSKAGLETGQFRDTIKFEHEGSHIFALDCEMCLSSTGYVLTRVSIVDFELNVIYDKLVKPDEPIVDYLTQYSGITEELLKDVTTTLRDVQDDILKIVSQDDILIGHSLNSDLEVLKIRHPKIVDTSIIFHHKAGPPFRPALRYLAQEYLNYDIQTDTGIGHNSIEDAKACMELVKLKIVNGLAFGVGTNTESIFHRLAKLEIKSMQLNDHAAKNYCSWKTDLSHSQRCTTDTEVFENVLANLENYDFFVCRLRGLEFARDYAKPSRTFPQKLATQEKALESFTHNLQSIHDKAPPGTLFLTWSGCGNTKEWNEIMSEINKLNKEQRKEEVKRRSSDIESAVLKARDSVAFTFVKQ